MRLTLLSCAAFTALAIGGAAQAATFAESQTQILESNGQDLTFSFAGLLPSDGTGGTLTVSSGINELQPGRFDGLDLNSDNEFIELFIDGLGFGTFNCTGSGGHEPIPGGSNNSECDFSLPVALNGSQLDSFLADGALVANINFSDAVGAFPASDRDQVIVSLTYETAVAAVPLPATGLLLLAGLGALAARRRA